jgi:hypothetical protein
MRKYKGYEAKQVAPAGDPLPAGGYVVRIISVKENEWKSGKGSSVVFGFDVIEGEYKGFFKEQYDGNTNEDKKWKGVLRVTQPNEKDQYYESQIETFNKTIGALEASNNGFHFDWRPVEEKDDWSQLKDKVVGVLYRNKEYEVDGRTGWTTEAAYFVDTEYIRSGKFKIPKDKPLKSNGSGSSGGAFAPVSDDGDGELPF